MDIAAIRESFKNLFNEISNRIEIWTAQENAFSIHISPNQDTEERYLIRFKNSLGAFEVIEAIGTATHEPKISEPDTYKSLTHYGFFPTDVTG